MKNNQKSVRRANTVKYIKKQLRILNFVYHENKDFTFKFHKHSPLNCGKPKCKLCSNPRKLYKYKTINEIKFDDYSKTFE